MACLRPADAEEARQMIAQAAADARPLEIVGGGSKRGFGQPARPDDKLDVSALQGIVDYEPSELRLTARAATPMAAIAAQLQTTGQMLGFEPADWSGVFKPNGAPTLGGVIACNLAGPRRVRAGAARDHFLGFSAVNGKGEAWKAGGKVVKNVTGYDMGKLQCGAFGTLSLLTEITVKVMPKPETSCSLLLAGLDGAAAVVKMAAALNTPFEVSAAAHLPAAVAARAAVLAGMGGSVTALRLEGPAPSVAYRSQALLALLGGGEILREAGSAQLWHEIGTVRPLMNDAVGCLWRICPAPAAAPAMLAAITAALPDAEALYDWGGGLVWLRLDPYQAGYDGGAGVVRAAVHRVGGHATLITAAATVRAAAAVFEPLSGPLAALTKRIKHSFDPLGILNPGRMQEGV